MGLYGGCQIGFPPLARYGSKSLKQKVIPPILRGEKRVCLAITEVCLYADHHLFAHR